jgi:hypothetical protein
LVVAVVDCDVRAVSVLPTAAVAFTCGAAR